MQCGGGWAERPRGSTLVIMESQCQSIPRCVSTLHKVAERSVKEDGRQSSTTPRIFGKIWTAYTSDWGLQDFVEPPLRHGSMLGQSSQNAEQKHGKEGCLCSELHPRGRHDCNALYEVVQVGNDFRMISREPGKYEDRSAASLIDYGLWVGEPQFPCSQLVIRCTLMDIPKHPT